MNRRKRPKQERETLAFISAASRFIRAAGARTANGDEPELAALLSLQADLDAAIQAAVDGQLAVGRSWAHIALATGKTRQAAFRRWGSRKIEGQARSERLYGKFLQIARAEADRMLAQSTTHPEFHPETASKAELNARYGRRV